MGSETCRHALGSYFKKLTKAWKMSNSLLWKPMTGEVNPGRERKEVEFSMG